MLSRSTQQKLTFSAVLAGLLACASIALAFDLLFSRVRTDHAWSELYASGEAQAYVRDGWLMGQGTERVVREIGGQLRIVQERTYTRAKHPKTGKLVTLPEPWQIRATLVLSPALRLVSVDTTLELHRSIDQAMGFAFSDKLKDLFDWQQVRVRASADGRELVRSTFRAGQKVETTRMDYDRDTIPIEIVGTVLPLALRTHLDTFEFDLMLPTGALHRVRARVLRTRDLTHFAQGYPLPADQLHFEGELAVVDLWLASPFKYVFFPHHFYFVYAREHPTVLLAFWGGDPEQHLQAMRRH